MRLFKAPQFRLFVSYTMKMGGAFPALIEYLCSEILMKAS